MTLTKKCDYLHKQVTVYFAIFEHTILTPEHDNNAIGLQGYALLISIKV